jgi:hypothetical protein
VDVVQILGYQHQAARRRLVRPRARPATGARRRPRGPFAEDGAIAGKQGGIEAGGRAVHGRICGRFSAARFPACGRAETGAWFFEAGAVYTTLLIVSRDKIIINEDKITIAKWNKCIVTIKLKNNVEISRINCDYTILSPYNDFTHIFIF